MVHWTTVYQGWSMSDDDLTLPVLTTTPEAVPPPLKPMRTVSLRQSTAGWHAAWIEIVGDAPVPVVQLLASPPEPDSPLIFTGETATRRLVFTCFRGPTRAPLPPPLWTDVPPHSSLPGEAQTTFASIVAALALPPASGGPLSLPVPDANAGRYFYRVECRLDSDFDGISDADELGLPDVAGNSPSYATFTDPFDTDTDHDGFPDGQEIGDGTDPLDPQDRPAIYPAPVLEISHRHGDFHWFETDPDSPYTDGHGLLASHREPNTNPSYVIHHKNYPVFPDSPQTLRDDLAAVEPFVDRLALRPGDVQTLPPEWAVLPLAYMTLDSSALSPASTGYYGEWDIHRFHESRIWLKSSPPTLVPLSVTLHFLTTGRYNQLPDDPSSGQEMTPTLESHTFAINPRGFYTGSDGVYSEPFDLRAVIPSNPSMQDGLIHRTETRLLPMEVNCPELYMFSGHTGDKVELCKASGTCEWKLKSASPAIGTFDHPTDLACSFTATTPGKNTIQLVMGGKVVWEKPTEIIDIVTRAAWGAVAPKAHTQTIPDFQHVTLHHTSNTNTGAAEMQRIQKLHMGLFPYNLPFSGGKNFDDIGYHFIMDKAGVVYEGRQLEAAPGTPGGPYTKGEHVATNNTVAGIGFCTMGDYEGTEGNEPWPAARQKDLEKAVSALCRRYKIPSSKLSYHKVMALAASPSVCPGSNYIPTIPDIIKHVNENLQ